mgnify:FL=1
MFGFIYFCVYLIVIGVLITKFTLEDRLFAKPLMITPVKEVLKFLGYIVISFIFALFWPIILIFGLWTLFETGLNSDYVMLSYLLKQEDK